MKKVQGDSFRREDRSAIAFDLEETVSILCPLPILAADGEDEGGIDGSKDMNGRGEACDHQRLLGDDACASRNRRGKEDGCRDVAVREVFLERQSDGAAYVGNRSLDHRLGSQHGAQLLLAAGEHDLIAAQACQAILMVGNDFRRGLGGKFLIAQFPLQPLHLLGLLRLLLE